VISEVLGEPFIEYINKSYKLRKQYKKLSKENEEKYKELKAVDNKTEE
jgi:hypothetical protein